MQQHFEKFVLLIAASLFGEFHAALHSGFTTCKTKDADFNSCLNKAIENGVKFIKNGLKEYNLRPLDPFKYPSMKIGVGAGAVNLEQNYKDITVTGFSGLTVLNANMDFDKKKLTFSTAVPLLTQKATYNIDGKILMLPVRGTGPSTLQLQNSFSNHTLDFQEQTKDGIVYYKPTKYTIKISTEHANFNFENLFDGNKLLGDNINKVVNQEWKLIFLDVRDGFQEAFGQIFLDYAKRIFEKVPMKEIFLE
ncbi:unnamed protein product [Ceutorhynchus assimilis]|uniref:Uncharacterized protein n=1 Tax=Ceutorhynchus assimilis TaxID=467358 RepID=A0A9N9QP17_9CUCU|nr:unnamed protein product [Ceutorhynchus assimilis]